MAASKLSICNLALSRIGASRITTLTFAPSDEIPKEAELCLLWYDQIVDEVLAAHPWNEAIVRDDISASVAAATEYGYAYKYTLPTNPYCLRVLQMEYHDSEWRVEGAYLLTDESECNILYISRITDPTKFRALTVRAIYTRLAQVLLPALSENVDLGQTLEKEYQQTLSEARHFDAVETSVQELETTTWLNSRD